MTVTSEIPAAVDDAATLDVRPNLDREPFGDLAAERWLTGVITRVGVVPDGTLGGQPALVVVVKLDDGTRVAGAVPYRSAEVAGRAIAAVWGEPVD